MDPVFAWIEASALSTWVRSAETMLSFPAILSAHALGLALLVGVSIVIDLKLLGLGGAVRLRALDGLMPVFWLGLVINVASGLLLTIAYPTKALTNPVFFLKLGAIAAGLALMLAIRGRLRAPETPEAAGRLRVLAIGSLAAWATAITAGRLLAYTYSRLTVTIDRII